MKGFKGNKQGAASGAAPTAPDNLEGGATPANPVSDADAAAAALQAQLDGKGEQPPAAETVTPPAGQDAKATEPTPPVVERTLNWYVRAGRSITSPRGVIGPNQQVTPDDMKPLQGEAQEKQLAYLAEKGILYRAYEPGNEILPPPKNPVDLRGESTPKKKK